MMTLRIADDFSRTPGGRFKKHGPDSGEEFRPILAKSLRKAIEKGERLVVILDGAAGYGSSFLDEAFAGLIRKEGFSQSDVSSNLEIRAEDSLYEPYRISANNYIDEACAN